MKVYAINGRAKRIKNIEISRGLPFGSPLIFVRVFSL